MNKKGVPAEISKWTKSVFFFCLRRIFTMDGYNIRNIKVTFYTPIFNKINETARLLFLSPDFIRT